MKTGTKSVLFGAHCFFIHPWFVAIAWWKLYGFPWDPRLWVAFFVHDLGYWGKARMDDSEGERHVEFGAKVMALLFDRHRRFGVKIGETTLGRWGEFTLLHSRFYAKKYGLQPSRLCVADKYAIGLTPEWLYLPMVNFTGEVHEYLSMSQANGNTKYAFMSIDAASQVEWYRNMQRYVISWAMHYKHGGIDTWTPTQRDEMVAGLRQ